MPSNSTPSFDVSALMPAFQMLTDNATRITEAYLANNAVPVSDIPLVVQTVQSAVFNMIGVIGGTHADATVPPVAKATSSEIRRSITSDHLISFEDGKPYRTLKRHLTKRSLTPDAYRAKWGLPVDYPMTAPGYSEKRSQLAKSFGLGTSRLRSADTLTH